eukprot:364774-Chlamydomonas_euryale.AAC.17
MRSLASHPGPLRTAPATAPRTCPLLIAPTCVALPPHEMTSSTPRRTCCTAPGAFPEAQPRVAPRHRPTRSVQLDTLQQQELPRATTMAGMYIHKVQTIMSMVQLEEESEAADGGAWGPRSCVGDCAGNPLPLYAYAPCKPPRSTRYRRLPSRGDIAIAVVPEVSRGASDESRCARARKWGRGAQEGGRDRAVGLLRLCAAPVQRGALLATRSQGPTFLAPDTGRRHPRRH